MALCALQMGQNELGSWVSLCEGLFLMASSIYLQMEREMSGQNIILTIGAILCVVMAFMIIKSKTNKKTNKTN